MRSYCAPRCSGRTTASVGPRAFWSRSRTAFVSTPGPEDDVDLIEAMLLVQQLLHGR